MKVAPACRLFGHCRQAYYQSKADIGSHVKNERLMLDTVREIRGEDPGIGGLQAVDHAHRPLRREGSCPVATASTRCFVDTA